MPPAPDLFSLAGRHFVVAGGAGLLGPSFAAALLECGALVTSFDIDQARLDASAVQLSVHGDAFRSHACDLTDEAAVADAVNAAERRRPLAGIINAAAINPKADADLPRDRDRGFVEYPLDAWRRSIEVNLTGAFLATREVCRHLEPRATGIVVNIASTYGLVGPDQRIYGEGRERPLLVKPVDYSVSKAGMVGFTRYLAAYYARTTIRVNCLTLGGVFNGHDAAFTAAYSHRTLLGRMANRDEYKGAIVFLCSDASSYMTGANLVVDGGWTAI